MKNLVLKNSFSLPGTIENKHKSVSDLGQEFFNSIPLDVTVSKSRYDTKMYVTVLLIAVSIAIPPFFVLAIYSYLCARRELATSISKFEKHREKTEEEKSKELS